MNQRKNTRKYERKSVDLSGFVKEVSKLDTAKNFKIDNISLGGACVFLGEYRAVVGDFFALLVEISKEEIDQPILVIAEVRWVDKSGKCGVSFVNLDPFSEARLQKILKQNGNQQ